MTIARRKQIRLDVTPFYHCITRCVRRAFLCGHDQLSGRNLNHRRQWIENHLHLLTNTFCIDIAAYAIMSNHYHVVLHVNQENAAQLSDLDVIRRWHKLYKGPAIIKRYVANECLDDAELKTVYKTIKVWREQLTNISRFMAHLNENIARRANKEDDCKGRFWESRFKLQAILDLKALLRTMCYVDLNPVRAKAAKSPESSLFTSLKWRLSENPSGLMKFGSTAGSCKPDASRFTTIPITFKEYQGLVSYTGRLIQNRKTRKKQDRENCVLSQLEYTDKTWRQVQQPKHWFQRALGNSSAIADYCRAIGQRWIWEHKP